MMFWLKDVYIHQGVECDWDNEYMNEYKQMLPIIEQRRNEMMNKFRPKRKEQINLLFLIYKTKKN